MPDAKLTINSRNYGAWSLRGWLLCKLAGLDVEVDVLPSHDPSSRAELMLLAPSFLVPRLTHGDVVIWDTLAIAEYLNEYRPEAGLLPTDTDGAGALPVDLGRDALRLRQPAIVAADEREGPSPRLPALGGRPGRHRPGDRDLAGQLRRTTAARTSTGRRPRWPTRCTRRSARGCSPTT